MAHVETFQPAGSADRPGRLPRGLPVFALVAVAILAFLAGGFGGSYQAKLSPQRSAATSGGRPNWLTDRPSNGRWPVDNFR